MLIWLVNCYSKNLVQQANTFLFAGINFDFQTLFAHFCTLHSCAQLVTLCSNYSGLQCVNIVLTMNQYSLVVHMYLVCANGFQIQVATRRETCASVFLSFFGNKSDAMAGFSDMHCDHCRCMMGTGLDCCAGSSGDNQLLSAEWTLTNQLCFRFESSRHSRRATCL